MTQSKAPERVCMFCGEDNPESFTANVRFTQPVWVSQVECLNCGAKGPAHYNGDSEESAQEGAVYSWDNERAPQWNSDMSQAPEDGTLVDLHDGEIRHTDCFYKMGVWFKKKGWPTYDAQVVGCTYWMHINPPE